jgi:hypothetical protein
VEVIGQVQFRPVGNDFLPVLLLRDGAPSDGVQPSTPPNNEYEV